MTQVTITFSILEYLPSNFNFNSFSFIISSESREFEQEISYASKNKISHKFPLQKKDAKYLIKVTKNNSLIGISDISIPYFIFQKREKNYQKACIINMTDSLKRVLFGNTSPENNLKIEINCSFIYNEKEKNNKINYSTNTMKKNKDMKNLKDMKNSGTFSLKNIIENKKSAIINNSNIKKHYSSSKSNKNVNFKSPKINKPKTHIFNYVNKEENNIINNKGKENKEIKEIINKNIIIEDKKEPVLIQNESVIDEELNKEIKENNNDFYNYINEFKEKHPLEKLDSINDINELNEQSKNIILELLDYQIKFYSSIKDNFSTKKRFKNLMIQYNEKLRNTKKEINKINEMIDLIEIKSEILDKNDNKNIDNFLSLKENELNNFNDINNNKEIKKEKENTKDNSELLEKGKNVLIKVLQQCIEKHGPINKIYTLTNSTEPERINIKKLAEKYNLPLNSEIKEEEEEKEKEKENNINSKESKDKVSLNEHEEERNDNDNNNDKENDIDNKNSINIDQDKEKEEQKEKNIFEGKITKWEYVSTEKPDKIDKKLELYLKYFYSKRTFPVVIFKKTSTNNYEYGKQKIMIKIEGDTIRVRNLGGYLIIDKFIELNAANEEKKLKKISEKNSNVNPVMNKKKENIQKKKTK